MAQKTRTELDAYFETGDTPTEAQFNDLIDSIPNFQDDKDYYGKEINITAFGGGGQANAYVLTNHVNVIIICALDFDSVKLPTGNTVRAFYIYNVSAQILDVFPPVGGEISNSGVNVAHPLAPFGTCVLINYDDKKWFLK